ncbi:MAG: YkgJ family cysteine cluster protein [Ferruginibacter sp.]
MNRKLEKDREIIAAAGNDRMEENDDFLAFMKQKEDANTDVVIHALQAEIADAIDCTACGACCQSLVINVTLPDATDLAKHLNESLPAFKEKYLEESQQGHLVVDAIPCHFLSGKVCTVYNHRFTECREFPHLHKPGFIARLPFTLMYYTMCPIIYNVVEAAKDSFGYHSKES